jgi:hypothetical protein
MVLIRSTDDEGEEIEEEHWTADRLAEVESEAVQLKRGEVIFIRPDNSTEIKTRAWCEAEGMFEVARRVFSGHWFELADDDEEEEEDDDDEGWEEEDEEDVRRPTTPFFF